MFEWPASVFKRCPFWGLLTVIDDTGFEVLVGDERIGSRRPIGPADVEFLTELADRYVRVVQAGRDGGVFVELGRELFGWLDADQGQLSGLLEKTVRPVVFEVRGPRFPSGQAWTVLRAPFELLARPGGGFLAADELDRFCVVRRLGPSVERPALDQFRLGLAFMASSPRGQHELDFEAEEAAILTAVGETNLDLLVEDTGDPEQLASRLAAADGMPVVHLSCHGLNNYPVRPGSPGVPVLMMEDDTGAGRPTTAGDLASLLTAVPRLLFVSACLTATGADATPRLLTGDGRDPGVGEDGRLITHSLASALVTAGFPAVLGWDGSVRDHSAKEFAQRLYQGLADRADLAAAAGDARRVLLDSPDRLVRADWHLARLWLGPAGGGSLVAGTRERSLVTATRGTKTFLDRKQQVPVATAEMFVGRRPELQQALRALRSGERAGVLLHGQGRLGKSSLAARIADRFPDHAVAVVFGDYGAVAIADAVAAAVRASPAARQLLESRLAELRQRPEAIEPVLASLLAGPCAQPGKGGRQPLLLIINDLEQILVPDQNGPHRVAPAHAGVLAGVLRAFDPEQTDSRLLVTSRFTFTLDGPQDRLAAVQLRQTADAALTSGDGQAGEALLDRAMRQAETAGGAGAGPLDRAGVIADRARHLITRGELDQAERLLRHACELFTGAGSQQQAAVAMGSIADIAFRRGDYDEALRIHRDIQLPAYGRLGDIREAAVTWGKIADIAYERGDYDEALRIRRDIQLPIFDGLDVREAAVTWGRIARIAYQRGDDDEALRIRRDEQLPVYERLGDVRSAAITWGSIADIAYDRGDFDEALRIRRDEQLPVFERLHDTRETALAWGKIADIFYDRGDYDEALRIRRDIELPALEDLDDTRETAVTWGKIADIAFQRGDYDQAAELQNKRLQVHRKLDDLDGIAAASWDLAQIDFARGAEVSAFPRLLECFEIYGRLQRPDGFAAVGIPLGQLLMIRGQPDQARKVLSASLAAATKIGWTEAIEKINELLDQVQ